MADCDFFPDDPSCQAPEANADDMGDKSDYYMQVLEDEADFLDMYGGKRMAFFAKLGFLVVAAKGAIYSGLSLWRYDADQVEDLKDSWEDGDIMELFDIKINWYYWAYYIMQWGSYGLFALGFVT